jgi:hypothetical protein
MDKGSAGRGQGTHKEFIARTGGGGVRLRLAYGPARVSRDFRYGCTENENRKGVRSRGGPIGGSSPVYKLM